MSSGVAMTPNIVVESVHTTDKATSPPASSANRLLACPPDTLPNSTIPAVRAGSKLAKDAIPRAKSGIIVKQSMALIMTMDKEGCCMAFEKSWGVMVSPMASMRTARAFCIMGNDPMVGAIMDDFLIAAVAAISVQRGANLQKALME